MSDKKDELKSLLSNSDYVELIQLYCYISKASNEILAKKAIADLAVAKHINILSESSPHIAEHVARLAESQ